MKVAELNIYPMKSARGIPLDAALCRATGLEGDRIAVLVHEIDAQLLQTVEILESLGDHLFTVTVGFQHAGFVHRKALAHQADLAVDDVVLP